MHISGLIKCLDPEVDRLDPRTRIRECCRHSMGEDSRLVESDIEHHTICTESLPYTQEKLSPSKLLQELYYLVWLISSRKYSSSDISDRDESPRYIWREHRHMPSDMIAISTIGNWIDRIDTLIDTGSISRECIVWDFHSF